MGTESWSKSPNSTPSKQPPYDAVLDAQPPRDVPESKRDIADKPNAMDAQRRLLEQRFNLKLELERIVSEGDTDWMET